MRSFRFVVMLPFYHNPSAAAHPPTLTIIGPQQDRNLGIQTFVNGTLVSSITLDTSAPATDTIAYVATDTWGNTATATRTVLIEATQTPSSPAATAAPPSDSTSTAATSFVMSGDPVRGCSRTKIRALATSVPRQPNFFGHCDQAPQFVQSQVA
jgi:hypothetical protein